MTHTHTIESGNARVSVEADDAARAVSEARRNWELNNGGVVSDDIARRIADAVRKHTQQQVRFFITGQDYRYEGRSTIETTVEEFSQRIAPIVSLVIAPLIQRAEAAERVINKLPKDGEGNPLAPGMKRWHRDIDAELHVEMVYVDECLCSGPKQKLVQGSDMFNANELFSTRDAALAGVPAAKEGT